MQLYAAFLRFVPDLSVGGLPSQVSTSTFPTRCVAMQVKLEQP